MKMANDTRVSEKQESTSSRPNFKNYTNLMDFCALPPNILQTSKILLAKSSKNSNMDTKLESAITLEYFITKEWLTYLWKAL